MKIAILCFAQLLCEIISIRTNHEYRNQALVIHLILVPPLSLPRDNQVINQIKSISASFLAHHTVSIYGGILETGTLKYF